MKKAIDLFLNQVFNATIINKYNLKIKFIKNDFIFENSSNKYHDLCFDLCNDKLSEFDNGADLFELVIQGKCKLSGNARFWKILRNKEDIHFQDDTSLISLLFLKTFNKKLPRRVESILHQLVNREQVNYQNSQLAFATIPNFIHTPFIDHKQIALTDLMSDHIDSIQQEAKQFIDNKVIAYPFELYGLDPITKQPKWSRWSIFSNGEINQANSLKFPMTKKFAELAATNNRLITLDFLILNPGQQLNYHSDGFSFFANWQCGIIVPDHCAIEVSGIKTVHKVNSIFAFDDSFIHSAWNRSSEKRVVLAAWAIHPEFDDEEAFAIKFVSKHYKWGI